MSHRSAKESLARIEMYSPTLKTSSVSCFFDFRLLAYVAVWEDREGLEISGTMRGRKKM